MVVGLRISRASIPRRRTCPLQPGNSALRPAFGYSVSTDRGELINASFIDLRIVAARTGARDIAIVETDVIVTHLLQLFSEHGLSEPLAFNDGAML